MNVKTAMESIIQSLRKLGSFTESELQKIVDSLSQVTFEEGEEILKKGDVCHSIYFLTSGCVRQVQSFDEDELIINLVVENTWFFDQESFVEQKPSRAHLICQEQCEAFELSIHTIHDLIAQSQVYFQLGKLFQVAAGNRSSDFHLLSPAEKYLRLLAENPGILQKFPLRYVASYLQITPETLSRVRKKISTKDFS